MKIIGIKTNDHIGDAVLLTAAVENYEAAYPGEVRWKYIGNYPEVFEGNPLFAQDEPDQETVIGITYAPFSQRTGNGGTLVEAYSMNLFSAMRKSANPRLKTLRPKLYTKPSEIASVMDCAGKILINAGWQECSQVKAWPHWQELVNIMCEQDFVQIGAVGGRNFSLDLKKVMNLRGKTSIRQMIAAAAVCKIIVSPASALIHMGAAFGKDMICLIGAREASKLTKYHGLLHLSSGCGIYTEKNACMKFRIGEYEERQCPYYVVKDGIKFSRCMSDISAHRVARELTRMLYGDR